MSSRKYTPEKINGTSEFAERQIGWQSKLTAISDGLLRRELFIATPSLA